MKKRDMENTLKTAFGHITPAYSDSVLSDCGEQEAVFKATADRKKENRTAPRRRMLVSFAATAAVLMLLLTGVIGIALYRGGHAVAYTVSIDVNPSVEIAVSKQERVLSVAPLNEDGRVIIGEMDFSGSTLEVTVNALLGSMLRNGYLSELSNSILITVQGDNADAVRKKLAEEVNAYLDNGAFLPSVVSFTDEGSGSDDLAVLAKAYGISRGKAKLIRTLTEQNVKYSEEELSKLSVNELNLLLEKAEVLPDTSISWSGEASTKSYIGEKEAERIALAHANAPESDVVFTEPTELDTEKGIMVYEVEFIFEGFEYEYEIHAQTGEILKNKRKAVKQDKTQTESEKTDIGLEEAKSIALADADVKPENAVWTKTKKDRDDSRIVYEIEFTSEGYEYEYEIAASDGSILERKKEAAAGETQENAVDIGLKTAIRIALDHAGIVEKDAVFTKKHKDKDDGRTVYEIEFTANGIEYEYEIGAADGAVLKHGEESRSSDPSEGSGKQPDSGEYIGNEKAKAIALKHAGVSSSDVKKLKCKLEKEHGTMVYEVEFKYNGYEYEYEINAVSGKIIKSEKERD